MKSVICYLHDVKNGKQQYRTVRTEDVHYLPISDSDVYLVFKDGRYFVHTALTRVLWYKVPCTAVEPELPDCESVSYV